METDLSMMFKGQYWIPIHYMNPETFDPETGYGERYRAVFVESGSGIANIGGYRCAFIAPCLLCLNETDRINLTMASGLRAQGFYFHPMFVNTAFDFDNMRNGSDALSPTDNLDRLLLSPFHDRDGGNTGYVGLGPATAKRVAEAFDGIAKEFTEHVDYGVCRTRSYLLEILFMLSRLPEGEEVVKEQHLPMEDTEIDKAILYLHTEYHRKITLEDITREVHMSRTTLSERFTRATGQPVMSYLISLRMRLATVMLRETSLPIGEIMERVGFGNSSHFIRTFRKFTGQSPSEYRSEHCWLLRSS